MEVAKSSSKEGGVGSKLPPTCPYARYSLDRAYPGGPSMRIVVDKIYVFWEIPTHSMTLIGTQSVLINITLKVSC